MTRACRIAAVLAALILLTSAAFADVEKTLPDGNHQVTLSVPDMECTMCSNAVTAELRHINGVVWPQCKIDDVKRTIVVTFEPSKVKLKQIVDAVKKAGFVSKPVEPSGH